MNINISKTPMKKVLFILSMVYSFTGCTDKKMTHIETATEYYQARNEADFHNMVKYINDSITIIEGDFIMPYNQASFYEVFKWDSMFQTSYKLIDIEEVNNQVIASIELNSIRNKFLKNENKTCQYRISFKLDKISRIETLECLEVDWEIWEEEKNKLVAWVKENHPSLDGFIYDMTMNGASNYLKAIELYNESNGAHQ